jgi:hypothetical protein
MNSEGYIEKVIRLTFSSIVVVVVVELDVVLVSFESEGGLDIVIYF